MSLSNRQSVPSKSRLSNPPPPLNKPVWGGTAGAGGTGETQTVTFDTASTNATDYKTVTAECGNTKTANVLVTEIELSFTGLARACAGGVDNDAHIFTLQFNAKQGTDNLTNTALAFSFESNQGSDASKKARFLTSSNPRTWAETATITTDNYGNASVTVLSSDTVSQNTKIVVKRDNKEVEKFKLNDAAVQGGVTCDFAASENLRRFGLVNFPDEEDTGWIFRPDALADSAYSEEVIGTSGTTPAKVYLKFQVDPSITRDTNYFNADKTPRRPLSDDGNWRFVNGHKLRIRIAEIKPQEGESFTGTISDYATLLDANGQPVDSVEAVTANDGAAQVQIEAGLLIDEALEVVLAYEDETEQQQSQSGQ